MTDISHLPVSGLSGVDFNDILGDIGIAERKIYKKVTFKDIPRWKGLSELSKTEVRNDIKDIRRAILDDESDSSLKSEVILSSSFPVSPRSTPKICSPHLYTSKDLDANLLAANEEALNFLRGISISRRELFNGEVEREKLDVLNQSLTSAIEVKTKAFISSKKEEENYLLILQAVYAKQIKLQAIQSNRNCMLFDMQEALERKQQAIKTLDSDIQTLKTNLSSKLLKPLGQSSLPQDESSILRVHLNKSNKDVVLFKGQCLNTPMGLGSIVSINPKALTVVIQLSFGKMYSSVSRVVSWRGGANEPLDASSEEVLARTWKTNQSINVPIAKKVEIRKLLGAKHVFEPTSTDLESIFPSGEGYPNGLMHSSLNEVDTVSSSSSVSRATASSLAQKGVNSRKIVKNSLFDEVLTPGVEADALPFAFAPPDLLPSFVERQGPSDRYKVEHCVQSFESDKGRLGSTDNLVCAGSIEDMKKNLKVLLLEIKKQQQELLFHMNQAESSTSRSLQITRDSSMLKLSMFTKRVRHRDNLLNHGISPSNYYVGSSSSISNSSSSRVDQNPPVFTRPVTRREAQSKGEVNGEISVAGTRKRTRDAELQAEAALLITEGRTRSKATVKPPPPIEQKPYVPSTIKSRSSKSIGSLAASIPKESDVSLQEESAAAMAETQNLPQELSQPENSTDELVSSSFLKKKKKRVRRSF